MTRGVMITGLAVATILAGCADDDASAQEATEEAPDPLPLLQEALAQLDAVPVGVEGKLRVDDDVWTGRGFVTDEERAFVTESNDEDPYGTLSYRGPDGAVDLRRATARLHAPGLPLLAIGWSHEILANMSRDGEAVADAERTARGWRYFLEREGIVGVEAAEVEVSVGPARLLETYTRRVVLHEQDSHPVEAHLRYAYEDVDTSVPAPAVRALALDYSVADVETPQLPRTMAKVWTFHGDGLPIAEVELHAKKLASSAQDLADGQTLWTMPLARMAWSEDDVTVLFQDRDQDGLVDRDDTLEVRAPDDGLHQVVLYDVVTQTYVVPGAAMGALGALAAAALVRR